MVGNERVKEKKQNEINISRSRRRSTATYTRSYNHSKRSERKGKDKIRQKNSRRKIILHYNKALRKEENAALNNIIDKDENILKTKRTVFFQEVLTKN